MNRLSKRAGVIALEGVVCGMAIAVMLCSSLLPGMEYSLPMIAGGLLLMPSIEFGTRDALCCYAAIAFLSLILPANKESALLFISLFGVYPIIKKYFERIERTPVEYLLKYLYFNAAAISAVLLASFVYGIPVDDGSLGRWGVYILLLLGNIAFLVYDIALTGFVRLYVCRVQPVLRKMLHL